MPVKFFSLVIFSLLLLNTPAAVAQSYVDYTSPVPLYMLIYAKRNLRMYSRMWIYY